jgi:hypothetical protein
MSQHVADGLDADAPLQEAQSKSMPKRICRVLPIPETGLPSTPCEQLTDSAVLERPMGTVVSDDELRVSGRHASPKSLQVAAQDLDGQGSDRQHQIGAGLTLVHSQRPPLPVNRIQANGDNLGRP